MDSYTVIEFFSGLGGWARAFQYLSSSSGVNIEINKAYDVNPSANMVYEHNFGLKVTTKSITDISLDDLEITNADIWVMSPPCQPFTRNNETSSRDSKDNRSNPLMHLVKLLGSMKNIPRYIALENVVGFEASDCRNNLVENLHTKGYIFQEFIISPSQIGIPNERPRYYLVALLDLSSSRAASTSSEYDILRLFPNYCNLGKSDTTNTNIASYLNDDYSEQEIESLIVSDEVLSKSSSWCFDIVQPESFSTACFTKSYSRYIKGTGSVLLIDKKKSNDFYMDEIDLIVKNKCIDLEDKITCSEECNQELLLEFSLSPESRKFQDNWSEKLKSNKKLIRYFSPEELLKIFGFNLIDGTNTFYTILSTDKKYLFPVGKLSLRKKYELIGNSLNVIVVYKLLEELIINRLRFKI